MLFTHLLMVAPNCLVPGDNTDDIVDWSQFRDNPTGPRPKLLSSRPGGGSEQLTVSEPVSKLTALIRRRQHHHGENQVDVEFVTSKKCSEVLSNRFSVISLARACSPTTCFFPAGQVQVLPDRLRSLNLCKHTQRDEPQRRCFVGKDSTTRVRLRISRCSLSSPEKPFGSSPPAPRKIQTLSALHPRSLPASSELRCNLFELLQRL